VQVFPSFLFVDFAPSMAQKTHEIGECMKIRWKTRASSSTTIISIEEIKKINEKIMCMTLDEIEIYNSKMIGIIEKDKINNYINNAITILEK
jgi:hypothetical protein